MKTIVYQSKIGKCVYDLYKLGTDEPFLTKKYFNLKTCSNNQFSTLQKWRDDTVKKGTLRKAEEFFKLNPLFGEEDTMGGIMLSKEDWQKLKGEKKDKGKETQPRIKLEPLKWSDLKQVRNDES